MADVAVKPHIEDLPQEALDYFEDDELRARCFIEKYALWDLDDKLLETHPTQMWARVAQSLAGPEKDPDRWFEEFSWLLSDFRFVPGGRVLHGAGNPRKVTLTNCLAGDTIVATDEGFRRLDDLAASQRAFSVRIGGRSRKALAKLTGYKETVTIRTKEGFTAESTPDHEFRLQNGRWVRARDLEEGDRIALSYDDRPFGVAETGDAIRGYAAGLFVGDGTFAGTRFSVANVRLFQAKTELPIQAVAKQYGGTVKTQNGMVLLNSRPWAEDLETVGISHGKKTVTDEVLRRSSEYVAGFLRGLFDADGCVSFRPESGSRSIVLTQSDSSVLERVQVMLLGFGVKSVIYAPRTATILASFPTGVYECRAPYRLFITRKSFETFCRRIGFLHPDKVERAEQALQYAPFKEDNWSARVSSVESTGRVEPVFDASVEEIHAFSAGGLQAHNCYFTSVEEDSLEAIFEWCKKAARTYSFGGGNGVDIGHLRPRGTPVHNAARTSSGAVSFMELFSTTTGTIGQHGRRGALMITCPVDHPDIQAFIHVKGTDLRSVRYANVSVKVTDEFMESVQEGTPFMLRFENKWTGRVEKEADARKLWDELIQSAHASAEPGIIFWDNVKRESPSEYCAPVEGTNPSLVAGTQVLTREGILPIDALEGRGTKVPVPSGGTAYAECIKTGDSEPIYRIELEGGHEYSATAQHEWPVWWTGKGQYRKIPTKYLRPGDRIPFVKRTELGYGTDGTYDEGFLAGVILGDGNITKRSDDGRTQIGFTFGQKDEAIKQRILDILESITGFRYKPTKRKREGAPWYEIHASSPWLVALLESWGLKSKEDGLPPFVWSQASEDFRRGLVDGLFSTDGFVTGSKSWQSRAVFVSSRKRLTEDLSKLLGFYGIKSYIRYAKRKSSFPNGKDYGKEYERWDLRISHGAALHFRSIFRLSHPDKQARLEGLRNLKREVATADTCMVRKVELTGLTEPVWDLRVDHPEHAFSLAHITTGNCGEQPLEHNGACTLGHVNLSAFIQDGFAKQADVDWAGLERAVRLGVRFLDDVVEVNLPLHAHPEQTEQARATRRIGLGVTGLGDMLAKLRIQYDSDEAIDFVDDLMARIRNWAYDASADLAAEKEPFPLFDADKHLARPFVQRLPEDIREKIRKQGLRNVCILTVAPVGSGSVLTGTSSGVEPIFSLEYLRRSESLSKEWYEVEHPLVREYRKSTGDQGDDLPNFFVTSHQIDPFFRVKMQGTLQRYIDSAISSTVNLDEDTSVETVKEIYEYAWKQGCKGVTVYREGSREGILLTSREKSARGEVGATETVAGPKEVGKPRARPAVVRGTTQKIETGYGKLYVTINEDENGLFEVFAQIGRGGGYTASFTEAVARLISLCLRSGIPADEVVDQLEGIRSPRLAWDHQEKIYSVPDALSKALKRHLSGYDQTTLQPQVESFGPVLDEELDKEARDGDEAMVRKGLSPECPECGSPLIFEENCTKCQHCGFSEC